jgi:hypothetical protein
MPMRVNHGCDELTIDEKHLVLLESELGRKTGGLTIDEKLLVLLESELARKTGTVDGRHGSSTSRQQQKHTSLVVWI